MTPIPEVHERYGGLLTDRDGRRVVAHYGRPERTYRAVRNVAGIVEHGIGVVRVEGSGRRDAVAGSLTNRLPEAEAGVYGFVLRDGTIAADAYVFDVGDALLGFVPPDRLDVVRDAWAGNGREVADVSRDFAVFGVYGPQATEAIASVCTAATPATSLSIARGAIRETGVTVIRDDGLVGETGYAVVARSGDAEAIFDAMVNRGLNAAPLGYETWETLTLEAGTPLFRSELRDTDPGVVGVETAFPEGAALDPADRRLCGFTAAAVPEAGATVHADGAAIGHVTRSVESPARETAIGFAVVDATAGDAWTIGEDGIEARAEQLPFVEGSARSARLPSGP